MKKFTYNEPEFTYFENKLIEFRNNTPLISVDYRTGKGKDIIKKYANEILECAKYELEHPSYKKEEREKFSLTEWKENKNRKVETRNGFEVRIIDLNDIKNGEFNEAYYTEFPLIANICGWIYQYNKHGEIESVPLERDSLENYDLFFSLTD